MEHWRNDSERHSQPNGNNHLLRHRNFWWLLSNGKRDCVCELTTNGDRKRIFVNDLRRRICYTYRQWCIKLFVE